MKAERVSFMKKSCNKSSLAARKITQFASISVQKLSKTWSTTFSITWSWIFVWAQLPNSFSEVLIGQTLRLEIDKFSKTPKTRIGNPNTYNYRGFFEDGFCKGTWASLSPLFSQYQHFVFYTPCFVTHGYNNNNNKMQSQSYARTRGSSVATATLPSGFKFQPASAARTRLSSFVENRTCFQRSL